MKKQLSPSMTQYLIKYYPNTSNKSLSQHLAISIHTLNKMASQLDLKKSHNYMKDLHKKLLKAKEEKYKANTKQYTMDAIQRNILIGSILGDGSLSLYGRSRNAHYREQGSDAQIPYRRWKYQMLSDLDFKLNLNGINGKLYSPSHPIYTKLYHQFYKNKIKTITEKNIKLLNHPIGLSCLFMDDGTLVIDSSRRKNTIYIFPRIAIYSQSFSKDENILLMDHIKGTFDIQFKLKRRPDGQKYILELNKQKEIMKFIEIVKPFIKEIPCMKYKIDLDNRLNHKKLSLIQEGFDVRVASLNPKDTTYSTEDKKIILKMRLEGKTYVQIADKLGRSYWGIVDKIRRMKI